MKRFLIIALVFLILGGAAIVFAPWKTIIEAQAVSALEARGYSDVSLHVSGLGLDGIVLSDITFGRDDPVTLKNVTVGYSLASLKSRRIEKLTVSSPMLVLRQLNGRWVLAHFQNQPSETASPITIDRLTEIFKSLPFDEVVVEEGMLKIEAEGWNLNLPLNAVLDKSTSKITYKADKADFRKGDLETALKDISADIALDDKSQIWNGHWNVAQVEIKGTPTELPVFSGLGTIKAEATSVDVEGSLGNNDKSYHMVFNYDYTMDKAASSFFTISSASMPWKEGSLKLGRVRIPLGQEQALHLNVTVDKVSVDELLGAMTGQRVTGTGNVSGTIPVTIGKKGDLTFGKGRLEAGSPGKIMMPPDAIPGDNEQIALVRDILSNLNYTVLSVALNNDDQNNLGVMMSVEGNNPNVYNGRAVKLNVNLTGDVLDFIQQNVMLLTKPQTLWEEGAHE